MALVSSALVLAQSQPPAVVPSNDPCDSGGPASWRQAQPAAPSLGPSSVTYLDEIQLGRAWSADIERKYGADRDERIERIGQSVARFADRPQLRLTFLVLNNQAEMNAFSLPAGHVYLTRGLLEGLNVTDDELAFILGHEIAHAAFRDIANAIVDQEIARYLNRLLCERLLGAGMPDKAKPASDALDEHLSGVFRSREMIADQFGILYALRAGYHADGASSFLEKLSRRVGDGTHLGAHPGALPPHPTIPERLEEIRKGVDQVAYAANRFEAGYRALVDGNFDRAIAIFEALVAVFPQSQNALVDLGAANHGKFRIASRGEEPAPVILLAENLEVRWKSLLGPRRDVGPDRSFLLAAREKYRLALALDPGNQIARNNLAVTFLDDRNADEAIVELEAAATGRNVEPVTYKNLAIAYCEKLKSLRREPAAPAAPLGSIDGIKGKAGAALSTYMALKPDDDEARTIKVKLLTYQQDPS
jgi:predicted Zn-dependent protease